MSVINISVSASSFKYFRCMLLVLGSYYDPMVHIRSVWGVPFEVCTYLFVIVISGK